jgi:hypothetical protein
LAEVFRQKLRCCGIYTESCGGCLGLELRESVEATVKSSPLVTLFAMLTVERFLE